MTNIVKWAIFLVGVLLLGGGIIKLTTAYADSPQPNNIIKITTYNPYSIGCQLELKCFDWKLGKFTFHKFIEIQGKQNTVIYVPNSVQDCQIWPKILW